MVGDVKGRIEALHPGGGHGLPVPQGADLLRIPLLDGDVVPVGTVQVDGGGGPQHIEGDPVVFGQDGHSAGADLVGGVAVGRHPVAAYKAGLDPSVLHHHRGHVVTDQGDVHPSLMQLPGGEPRPLEQGPGLVGEHPQGDPPFPGQQDGTQGGAVSGGGQRPRVAVGQHPVPRLQQGEPVLRNGAAHLLILPADGPALRLQSGGQLLRGASGQSGGAVHHALHCPGQIDRRRA